MQVTMEQVINKLDREEPDYRQAARLGSEALPHLMTLIQGGNLGLAAKAASLAGMIKAPQSVDVLEIAARHPDPIVRVAAAASSKNLTSIPTSLATALLSDSDAGVRKWALKVVAVHRPAGIKTKVEEIMKSDPDERLRDRAKQVVNELP